MKSKRYFTESAARDFASRQDKASIIESQAEERFEVRTTLKPVLVPGETVVAAYQRGVQLRE